MSGRKSAIQRMVVRIVFLEWWRRKKVVIKKMSSKGCVQRWSYSVKSKDGAKDPETQGEPTRRGSGLEEDCDMEVEKKRTARKSWTSERKACRNSCETLRSLQTGSRCSGTARKKSGRDGYRRLIERKRTELLLEDQKMQKRSQKLQSLQDKKRNYLNDTCTCEEEMRKLSADMEERQAHFQARFQALSEKSGNCRRAAGDLEEDIQTLQERKEEAAVRRSPMDVALIQPCWSRSSRLEQQRQNTSSKPCRKSPTEGPGLQPLQSKCQEEKRKKIGKEIGVVRRRQLGGTKALQWILLWILLGAKMQMVEALEEKIPAHPETECMLVTALVSRVRNEIRGKMMDACDKGWREGEHGDKGKHPQNRKKKPPGKGPKHL